MDSQQIEERRKRITKMVKVGLGGLGILLALGVAAPLLIAGVEALLAVGAAFVIGGTAIAVAPVVGMKVANWRIRAITNEAERNPIETMKSLQVEKSQELEQSEQAITEFETEIRNYNDELKDFIKEYPEEAESYKELSTKMKEALQSMREEQELARDKLQEFVARIVKAEAIYKMALAAQRVTSLSKSAEAKVFMEIKEKVAFDTVRGELNRSFSQLNTALAKRNEPHKIPTTASRIANVQPVGVSR